MMGISTSISIADIAQVILGAATLYFAWRVFKKLIPSEHKIKQLEAVLELVQHLNTYTFTMHRMEYTGMKLNLCKTYLNLNMFEYRAAYSKKDDATPIAPCRILLLSENQPFELSKFIENPLMPKKIVPHLANFISLRTLAFQDKLETQDNVIVFNVIQERPNIEIKQEMLYKGTATALSSHAAFLDSINGLYDAIEEWCRLNGLDDLNFRMHNSRGLIA